MLAVALLTGIGFGILYFTRFQTIATLKRITGYEDMQEFTDAVVKECLPLLPVKIKVPSFGCRSISFCALNNVDADKAMQTFRKERPV